jgi:hypothetical protein
MHSKYGENLTILLTSFSVNYCVYGKITKLPSISFFKYYYYDDQIKKKTDMVACESSEIHNLDVSTCITSKLCTEGVILLMLHC